MIDINSKSLFKLLVSALYFLSTNELKEKRIHIGAVFPMSGDWAGGIGCRPAALMALDDVNNQSKVLPDYHLTMTMGDSQCVPGLGAKMMYELLYKPPTKIIFLTGCSTVTTFVAQAAPRWNLIVVAYGSSSPALSNRARFPSFFRTHPSASLQNPTRMKLIKQWGWKKISILWEMEEVFTSTVQDLEKMAKLLNITIVKRQSFQKHSQAVSLAVKSLRNEDARVIVGLFYEKFARKVFCEAYHQGLFGKKIVWIVIGWYADDWWKSNLEKENINCTVEEMQAAVEGHLTTESLMWNTDDKETVGGLTTSQFRLRLAEMLREPLLSESDTPDQFNDGHLNRLTKIPGYPEAPLAYDAVWAIALALDKAEGRLRKMGLSISDFQYHDDPNVIYEQLHKAMNETNFIGVSLDGSYHLIGYYHFETDNLTLVTEPKWQNDIIPRDSIEMVYKRQVLSLAVYCSVCAVVILCILCTMLCVTVIQRSNHVPTIYDSLKIVCCSGCIISLLGVVLLGIDRTSLTEVISDNVFTALCQAKVATISLGFNFGYGSLFLSIWLVYRTTTQKKKLTTMQTLRHLRDNDKHECQSQQVLRNTQCVVNDKYWEVRCPLAVFCVLDVGVLGIWQYFDALTRTKSEFPKEHDLLEEDIHYYPYIEVCDCKNISLWLGIIFGWKGLLLILGILLAYETRNTKMSKSEEVRATCMAVYNVVTLAIITGPVSIMIRNQQTAHFAFVSISVLVCCSLSIGLIFVPKYMRHRKGIAHQDNIIISDIDTIEETQDEDCNRHRLKMENEDLKIKILKIEKDIERLQAQLRVHNHINDGAKNQSHVSINCPISGRNDSECGKQRAYNRRNVVLLPYERGRLEDGMYVSPIMVMNESSFCRDKRVDEDISECVENTSGVYSDLVATASVNCTPKY